MSTMYNGDAPVWRTGYIISDEMGNVLTDASNPNNLEWISMALLEEKGREALVFSNPYKIPARIAAQLTPQHQVFSVHLEEGRKRAHADEVMMANFIGPYTCIQRPADFMHHRDGSTWSKADISDV